MSNRRILASVTAALAALAIGAAPAAHADDYSIMKATELQQAVLRAQMPTTLGAWSQNYYYSDTGSAYTRPTLCWDAEGAVKLPQAKVAGSVGYTVNASTTGAVTIYQYADAAAAQAALAALQKASCSDSPRIANEGGELVKAQSGSDFTDASMTGYAAGVSYADDGRQVFEDVRTTQRGLAIVQTKVYRSLPGSTSTAGQQKAASRIGAVNRAWHANVVRAYASFGQGRAS